MFPPILYRSIFLLIKCVTANATVIVPSICRQLGARSPYVFLKRYRCHHNTRHDATKNVQALLKANPSRRIKNTNCPFAMTIEINNTEDIYPCHISLEWNHNHALHSLQVNSFKDLLPFTQGNKFVFT